MKKDIRKLSQSFRCAGRGIMQCIKTERNFRVHLCAAAYVSVFAVLGQLSGIACALICVCFALMLGAELINTAIERLCDLAARGYDGTVRDAKDLAAAAVFVCALFCAVIGAALFLQGGALQTILAFFQARLWALGILVLSVPITVAFIFDLGRHN